jgi:hypothetical protein
MVKVSAALTFAGALNWSGAPLALAAEAIAPHATTPVGQVTLQVTPLLLGSWITMAVKASDWLMSMAETAGASETLMLAGGNVGCVGGVC